MTALALSESAETDDAADTIGSIGPARQTSGLEYKLRFYSRNDSPLTRTS